MQRKKLSKEEGHKRNAEKGFGKGLYKSRYGKKLERRNNGSRGDNSPVKEA